MGNLSMEISHPVGDGDDLTVDIGFFKYGDLDLIDKIHDLSKTQDLEAGFSINQVILELGWERQDTKKVLLYKFNKLCTAGILTKLAEGRANVYFLNLPKLEAVVATPRFSTFLQQRQVTKAYQESAKRYMGGQDWN